MKGITMAKSMGKKGTICGPNRLQSMQNKGMDKVFPGCDLEVEFCEHCIYGK
jgi:hypothetical protein